MPDPTPTEQLAQDTAEYIASHLARSGPDYRVTYRDAQRPPTDIQAIKEELLSGHVWVSWLDAKVMDAMRAMWGPPTAEDQHGR